MATENQFNTVERGLRFRITNTGKKSFVYRYNPPGSRTAKQIKLGAYPKLSLSEARGKVRDARKLRDEGIDPQAAIREERQAAVPPKPDPKATPGTYTVNDLAKDWLDEVSDTKSDHTYKQYKGMVDNHIKPALGTALVADVMSDDIADLLADVARKTPVAANRLQSAISAMFSWCLDNRQNRSGLVHHPYYGRRKKGGAEVRRIDREDPLTVIQVAERITKVNASEFEEPARQCIEFIYRTGLRVGEASALQIKQVDLDDGVVTFDSSSTKNRRYHKVLLSKQCTALLRKAIGKRKRGAVFPNPDTNAGHVRQDRINKIQADLFGSGDIHIARHAMSSWAKEQRYDQEVRNRLTNHVDRGIDATYSFAEMNEIAKKAWQKWSNAIDKAGKAVD
jgi:integrase